MSFILVKDEGRDITLVPNLVRRALERADIVLRIDSEGLTIVKNRVAFREVANPYSLCREKAVDEREIQLCGHLFSSIVYSDEGTHYCRQCEREAKIASYIRVALDYLLPVQEASLREPFSVADDLPIIVEFTDHAVTRLLELWAMEEK